MIINRRAFLGMAIVGGSAALLSAIGCGGSSSKDSPGPAAAQGGNCNANGTGLEETGLTESHTHTIQLTAAQIAAADPNAVFMTSSVGHTHPVQLSVGQYALLASNQGISMSTGSGGDGHIHSVTFNCA